MNVISYQNLVLRAGVCIIAVILTCTAARSYEGKIAYAQAEQTQMSAEKVKLLQFAVDRNPDDSQAILDYSDALRDLSQLVDSDQILADSSIGNNHWLGWHRQGLIRERKALAPGGSLADATKAVALFDKVIRVHPHYVPALEHRGIIALELKQWGIVASIADQIEAIDFNYLSANYLRARLATEVGKTTTAVQLLKKLVDQQGFPSSLFTRQSIRNDLETMTGKRQP